MIGQYVTMFGDVIRHVNISAVKSEDGGEYECKASSRARKASHAARLNICDHEQGTQQNAVCLADCPPELIYTRGSYDCARQLPTLPQRVIQKPFTISVDSLTIFVSTKRNINTNPSVKRCVQR
ncbi:uncharacterized protein LOC105665428 [Ceratitis capitata]|uniref:uncharacterized protein LOC105665428 n=1 Tax=Ceratitis capitata TaxID=7213 RepID=UPI00061893D6|nr:uncharacterized protein LOC105665428 [Ceratitis capitata]